MKTNLSSFKFFGVAILFSFLVFGCGGQNPARNEPQSVDFVVQVNDETFVIRLTKPDQIATVRARLGGTAKQGIISGKLVDDDGGYNRDLKSGKKWTWHIEDISFPSITIELCDGRPSDVERDKQHWINDVKMFCPWTAMVIKELPLSATR